ncbi:MAG TPA: S41 family peptidase [Bauldia sp.]|nr:S41 family peptidase [Bauldia sp.]
MIRRFSLLLAGVAIGALATVAVTQPQFLSSSKAVAASSDAYRELNLFGDVFERVRSDYVEVPDDNQLIESAINGMLAGLDPHSSYMNAKDYKDMQVTTSGKFGGLGIQVTMEDGIIKVISPMDGSPAAKAGILANDKIIALDGDPLTGVTLDAAVDKMRGDIGTPITLTILRGGDDKKPFDIKLVRAEITVQAVTGRAEGNVIYVRIASFSDNAFDGLKSNIDKLTAQIGKDKLQGVIVDLRNDPGGLLPQAIAVSDAFLNEGEIVSTRGRRADETERYNAHSGDLANGKPVIVLVNGGSASASEIVAGALQDQRRATILGTRSFGKGSVQTIVPLGKDGALRLTTARYYTPSGRSIQAKGIEPDIEVIQDLPPDLAKQFGDQQPQGEANLKGHLVNDDEKNGKQAQSGSLAYVPPDAKDDKQLQYALSLLRGLQVNAAFPPDPNRVIPN